MAFAFYGDIETEVSIKKGYFEGIEGNLQVPIIFWLIMAQKLDNFKESKNLWEKLNQRTREKIDCFGPNPEGSCVVHISPMAACCNVFKTCAFALPKFALFA